MGTAGLKKKGHCLKGGVGSIDGLIGRNIAEFVDPSEHRKVMANLQVTLKEGVSRNKQYRCLRADGSEFAGEVNNSVLKDAFGN